MSTCPNGHIDNSAKFHKDNYVTPNLPILSKRANQNAIEIMGDSVRRVFNKKKNTLSAYFTIMKKKSPLSITCGHDTLDCGHISTENCCYRSPENLVAEELELWISNNA